MLTRTTGKKILLKRIGRHQRRGAATVEMAVVTPILMTMLFGIVEFGWSFMLQESATNATREAARMAVLQGADRDQVIQQFKEAMAGTGLTDGMTTDGVTPDDCPTGQECSDWTLTVPSQDELDDRVASEDVEITVSIPEDKASLAGLSSFLGVNRSLSSKCTMRKEGLMTESTEQ